MRVKSDRSYRVNDRLRLLLSPPQGEEVACTVRVAWSGGAPERGYEAGMQILEVDAAGVAQLHEALCQGR